MIPHLIQLNYSWNWNGRKSDWVGWNIEDGEEDKLVNLMFLLKFADDDFKDGMMPWTSVGYIEIRNGTGNAFDFHADDRFYTGTVKFSNKDDSGDKFITMPKDYFENLVFNYHALNRSSMQRIFADKGRGRFSVELRNDLFNEIRDWLKRIAENIDTLILRCPKP